MTFLKYGFLFILCLNSLAYSGLVGCYETISINGNDVVSGPSLENSESELFMTANQYYRDLDTFKELNTLVVSVFNGYNEPYYGFSNVVIPVDKGTWSTIGSETTFTMDQDIMYYSSNYKRMKIDFLIDASFKNDGEYVEGKLYLSSIRRGMFYDFSVKLKRKDCI